MSNDPFDLPPEEPTEAGAHQSSDSTSDLYLAELRQDLAEEEQVNARKKKPGLFARLFRRQRQSEPVEQPAPLSEGETVGETEPAEETTADLEPPDDIFSARLDHIAPPVPEPLEPDEPALAEAAENGLYGEESKIEVDWEAPQYSSEEAAAFLGKLEELASAFVETGGTEPVEEVPVQDGFEEQLTESTGESPAFTDYDGEPVEESPLFTELDGESTPFTDTEVETIPEEPAGNGPLFERPEIEDLEQATTGLVEKPQREGLFKKLFVALGIKKKEDPNALDDEQLSDRLRASTPGEGTKELPAFVPESENPNTQPATDEEGLPLTEDEFWDSLTRKANQTFSPVQDQEFDWRAQTETRDMVTRSFLEEEPETSEGEEPVEEVPDDILLSRRSVIWGADGTQLKGSYKDEDEPADSAQPEAEELFGPNSPFLPEPSAPQEYPFLPEPEEAPRPAAPESWYSPPAGYEAFEDTEEAEAAIEVPVVPERQLPVIEEEEVPVGELRDIALEDYQPAPLEAPVSRWKKLELWIARHPVLFVLILLLVTGTAAAAYIFVPLAIERYSVRAQVEPTVSADLLPYPIGMRLTGGWYFNLQPGQVTNGQWEPETAEWLQGSELRRVIAIPWSRQAEAVARSLLPGDEIGLFMNNDDVYFYEVKEVSYVERTEVNLISSQEPSLLIILYQPDSEKRWVVLSKPK